MRPITHSNVKIIDPCNDGAYKEWVVSNPDITIFHSPEWAKLLKESYGYTPRYFVLYRGREIKACLPIMEVDSFITGRRGVSLSFSDFCPALIADREEFQAIFESVLDYGRSQGWDYAEFRGETFLSGETPCIAYVQHALQLQQEEVMYRKLRDSSARNIQKAIKEGVLIEIGNDLFDVLSYYRLHCITRKRQGLPPQPKRYFINLYKILLLEGLGFTALAKHEGKVIAGLICLHYGSNAIYKYGASDDKHQRVRANNLLFWEMIKKCTRDNFKSLSLGRTDLDNNGLLLFKDGWGGARNGLSYHRYDFKKEDFAAQLKGLDRYESYMKKLPVGALRVLGTLGYRHMG